VPKTPNRPIQPVPRYTLTRREAAAAPRHQPQPLRAGVRPELKVVISGQLVLIPATELERWVERNARHVVDPPSLEVVRQRG
jgi:hypothetical protein